MSLDNIVNTTPFPAYGGPGTQGGTCKSPTRGNRAAPAKASTPTLIGAVSTAGKPQGPTRDPLLPRLASVDFQVAQGFEGHKAYYIR